MIEPLLLFFISGFLSGSIAFLIGAFYGYVNGRHDERFGFEKDEQ